MPVIALISYWDPIDMLILARRTFSLLILLYYMLELTLTLCIIILNSYILERCCIILGPA